MVPLRRHALSTHFRYLFSGTHIAAALMPFVPDQVTVGTLSFVILFCAWGLVALYSGPQAMRSHASRGVVFLVMLFASIAASLPIALGNGVSPAEWFRAAAPFMFLGTYAFFPMLTEADCQFMLRSLLLAVTCWVLKALLFSLSDFLQGRVERITYLSGDFQLPYGLIGVPLLLFWGVAYRPFASTLGAALLVLVIVITGYRSQAIIVALLWLAFVMRQHGRVRWLMAGATVATGVAALIWLQHSSFGEAYLARFELLRSEADSSRRMEILYGVERFAESPFLGNGLGFPVPIAVNQFGTTDSATTRHSDHVTYIHNLWVYLCMDLGVAGFLMYLCFFVTSVIAGFMRHTDGFRLASAMAVASLLAYFTVEAAFREVQMNLVLASLCALLLKARASSRHLPLRRGTTFLRHGVPHAS